MCCPSPGNGDAAEVVLPCWAVNLRLRNDGLLIGISNLTMPMQIVYTLRPVIWCCLMTQLHILPIFSPFEILQSSCASEPYPFYRVRYCPKTSPLSFVPPCLHSLPPLM